jgi:hypothetical protein
VGPAQHDVPRHRAHRDYEALLAGLDDSTPEALIAKARLGSIAAKEPQPTARCLVLPDGNFDSTLQVGAATHCSLHR